ncbi:TonB-dependent receptor domain-containing protein [Neptunicella marina]|uniref:TonB-dependent receptor n=1 Tax=Neptunicella marina TaxID=2125989 RepID=A0A8J6ITT1_9ALTE|nr:TonB-dependent receptor [Neptunicella marina]MBC3765491.1 TonB-dependent receptor [Neptunicella marina]
MKQHKISKFHCSTLSMIAVAVGMALIPGMTLAQEQPATPQDDAVEKIAVTGTRLAPRGMDSPTPVNVVGEEEFVLSGTQNVEELMLDTPQFSGNQLEGPKSNTVQAGQPIGVSTLNLRNFGATRNLVLVNGRRFAITGPSMTTDINTIPAALIQRTEIVTGGSSAVYGSDAITGVVNFVMKDDFEGVEVNAQSSWDQPSSAPTYNIDLTFGGNLDNGKGNITASLGYLSRKGFTTNQISDIAFPGLSDGCVTADSWSNKHAGIPLDTGGQSCEAAGGRLGFVTGGSSSVPNGRIGNLPTVGSAQSDPELDAALVAAGLQDMTGLGAIFDKQGSSVRPFISPDDRFDFNDNSFVLAPQERWMGNVFANYDLSDDTQAYMELHYSGNVTSVQIAPPNVGENFLFDVDNPYLSQEMQNLLTLLDARETGSSTVNPGNLTMTTVANDGLALLNYGRRFNDLGGRYAEADHNVFRTVVGVKGFLPSVSSDVLYDLTYDIYYSYAKTTETDLQTGSVSKSAVQRLLLSQNGEAPVLNLFGNGNISEAAAQAISIGAVSKIEAEQKVAVAALTGVAFDMPAGPVDFAFGLEWRDASGSYTPDSYLASGDVSGWNSAKATSGSQSVKEVFGEIRVPVLADMPGIKRLDVNGAFRYSDYDVGSDDSVWTYSTGVEWAVNSDLSFRGQFQHAIRAPNIGELFGGQGSDGPTAIDPCSAGQPAEGQTQTVRDLCIATGVPADAVFTVGVQTSPFLTQIRGGNPELTPEESDTTTLGVIVQPQQVRGLAVAIDYFDIELEDAIAPLGGGGLQNVLDLCYSTLQDANSVYCQAINRDSTGQIAAPKYVYTTNANIGGIKTSGIDINASYTFDVDWGLFDGGSKWSLNTSWTYTDEFTVTPIQELPDITNECVGAFGNTCGQPLPEWKGSSRITWENGPALVSLRMRYLGEVTTDNIVVPEARGESAPSPDSYVHPTIDSYAYFDLTGGYQLSEDTDLTVGMRNIFDKKAPIMGSLTLGGANTIPSTYDVQGRTLFVGINAHF